MLQVLAGEQSQKSGSDIVRGVDDAVRPGQNIRSSAFQSVLNYLPNQYLNSYQLA